MNQQIRKLSQQAKDYVAAAIELGFPQEQVDDIRDEKFAQLLIEQCIRQLVTINKLNSELDFDSGVRVTVDAINRFFEIEQ